MPARSVITVAMTDGAMAEEVAREVARALGYRYINDEILDRAAKAAGVDAKTVAAAEHSEPPVLQRIIELLADSDVRGPGGVAAAHGIWDPAPGYRSVIQDVVRSVAAEGAVVIGAHGASMTLVGTPGLLRVLVTAPLATRVARVARDRNLGATVAREEVERADQERMSYFHRFFGLDAELVTHYDIVVNTEALTVAEAARGIVAAAG